MNVHIICINDVLSDNGNDNESDNDIIMDMDHITANGDGVNNISIVKSY